MKYYPVVTYALIALSVFMAALTHMGESLYRMRYWLIIDPMSSLSIEIWKTEFWRLITPIFIHFGFLHILFNMLCLKDFGPLIEQKKGSSFLAVFVCVVAIISNVLQLRLGHSPYFGGMSGVIYGLFGYMWMQGKYNPRFGYPVSPNTVAVMLAWFVLCLTGVLGHVANWTHLGGLVVGVFWGYSDAKLAQRAWRKTLH